MFHSSLKLILFVLVICTVLILLKLLLLVNSMELHLVKESVNTHLVPATESIGSYHQDESENYLSDLEIVFRGTEDNKFNDPVSSNCSEKQNFVFIKVMKCATESLGPMFRKFGYDRNLTYVLPVEDRIWIGWPFPFNQYDYRPSRKSYNILVEHSIYNKTTLRHLLTNDTIYISSIREPYARLKSVFNFFHLEKICNITNHTDPITEYLHLVKTVPDYKCTGIFTDWRKDCPPVNFSQTHHEMSHSLGMPLGFPHGRTNIEKDIPAMVEYIQQLEEDFHLIMIVEYLHESLILLKRLMCWTFQDIFYIKRNIFDYPYKKTEPTAESLEFYHEWNQPDYLLYKHFNDSLWRKIEEQSDDFFDEVAKFTEVQKEGEEYCAWKEYVNKGQESHVFNETRWSRGFTLTALDCHLLLTDMLQHLKDIYDVHERSHHPPPDIKTCRL